MKSKRPIFFTTGANCLDHKAPVIHKLATKTDLDVDLVFWRSDRDQMGHLVDFLQQFESVNIYTLDQFLSQGTTDEPNTDATSSSGALVANLFEFGRQLPTDIPETVYNLLQKRLQSTDPRIKLITKQIATYEEPVLIFDWDLPNIGEEIISRQDNPILSFPHGDRTFQNAIRQARILKNISPHVMVNGEREFESISDDSTIYSETEIVDQFDGPNDPEYYRHLYKYNSPEENKNKNMYDAFVVPHEPAAIKFSTFVDEEKLAVTGSPRYNNEWLDILSTIAPTFKWQNEQSDNLDIVLFLRSFHYFILKDMVYNTINVLTRFPGVNLVVKEHPTSSKLYDYDDDFDPTSNLKIVKDEAPSVSLLEWGDVFLDVGSSIVYEAIQRNKPVLSLNYLHSNTCIYSERMPSTKLGSLDELFYTIAKLSENPDHRTYSERDREEFVGAMIRPNGDPLDNCVDLIMSYI
jgi:hypothetical protein